MPGPSCLVHVSLLILRRLAILALVLLVTSFILFGAVHIAPGSPLGFILQGQPASPETVRAVEEQYHLNDPFLVAYGNWLGGILTGDLGTSLASSTPVWTQISPRLGITVFLVLYATLLKLVVGIGSGIVAGLSRRVGASILAVWTIAIASPVFLTSVVLAYVFGVKLEWFPVIGAGSGFFDRAWHLTLPAIALALHGIGYVSRVTALAVTDELGREHVTTARARGIPEGRVVRHHVLRNAMIPIVTVSSLSTFGVFASVAVVETAFGIDGIGSYLIHSVEGHDFSVVQALILLIVLVIAIISMAVDALYAVLDPRIATEKN